MSGQISTRTPRPTALSTTHGFLPDTAPLSSFPSSSSASLTRLDELATNLSDYLSRDELRPSVCSLEPPLSSNIEDCSRRELLRLYAVTGILASAYIHKIDAPDTDILPAGVAVPLYQSATRLGRSPVLSYDSYVLQNWKRNDCSKDFVPTNIDTLLQFDLAYDECWFVAIHVAIENAAAPAINALGDLLSAIHEDNHQVIKRGLGQIETSLADIVSYLGRMPEHNSPAVFNSTFRQYLQPLNEITYEGVNELDGPQSFRGASGAQTALFAALDAVLGIDHDDNPLINHVRDLRKEIPPSHTKFIQTIEQNPDIRSYISTVDDKALTTAYNNCLTQLLRFRECHANIVKMFLSNDHDGLKGTGGTPYGHYLDQLTETTRSYML